MMSLKAEPKTGYRPRILHISADYPDTVARNKTGAIRSLLELVETRFDHDVISLNRVTPAGAEMLAALLGAKLPFAAVYEPGLTSLRYKAFPKGLWHLHALQGLADALVDKVLSGSRPDLIIGHKLTVEGLVVERIANALNVPYAITIQGNTDAKILAARPDLASHFADVLRRAAVVFPLAPWALDAVCHQLRVQPARVVTLPCPVSLDTPVAPVIAGQGLLCAFHLKNHKCKNLARLVNAVGQSRQRHPNLRLTLAGGGTTSDLARVQNITRRSTAIDLIGPIDNTLMPAYFNRAIGFAMPSLRESFGMVFIEALFCGAPIVYPAGRAVQGYFDGMDFAIPVDPHDTSSIAEGLSRLVRDEARLKSMLAAWQQSPEATHFKRASIADRFAEGIAMAINICGPTPSGHIRLSSGAMA